MSRYLRSLKENVVTKLAVLAVLLMGLGTANADTFTTGSIDFSSMSTVAASISSATLVLWRTGTAGQTPVNASGLSFAYLQSGTNLPPVSRTSVKDNSANNQGYLWSDNAIKLSYQKPNSTASAILIHTNNTVTGASDPLNGIQLRGGLIGGAGGSPTDGNRASVLPLVWKEASLTDLQDVSGAKVDGSATIPATSLMFMPTYITASAGGSCPTEGPYASSVRANNGFCDYSTHFFLDTNNTDPGNLWYTGYPNSGATAVKRLGAFNYASLVNAFGDSATEQGGFGPGNNPMYAVLGVNATNALQTKYGATIVVEVLNF